MRWLALLAFLPAAQAQVPPSRTELVQYRGLFAAAVQGQVDEIRKLVAAGEKPDARLRGYREMVDILERAGAR